MLFLSKQESRNWTKLGYEALRNKATPTSFKGGIRMSLLPAFHYFVGTLLAAQGEGKLGTEWMKEGTLIEEDGLFSNAFVLSFLERQQGRLVMPEIVFADPAPWLHLASVPVMKDARRRFVGHCGRSLPRFERPFRVIDIGCGDGGLIVSLIKHLREVGKVGDVGEILLVDQSRSMVELAAKTVCEAFPSAPVRAVNRRIEDISDQLDESYDLALSSLAYHHMPLEQKRLHLSRLKARADHFIIFELDANHDLPELHSPELALSLYQAYGRMIDFVFKHDASLDLAVRAVDCLVMSEAVSMLTQPRGVRNDYHMLRTQWHSLFQEELGEAFSCWCDSVGYADDYLGLFTLHYGRDSG